MDTAPHGAHWFRFADAAHAAAMFATLDGWDAETHQPGHIYPVGAVMLYDHGAAYAPTGETDGEGNAIMAARPGHFACLITMGDILPPDGWGPWLWRFGDDEVPPAVPGGWREQVAACQELASVVAEDAAIPETVPPPLTPEQREARREARQARAAAQAEVIAQRRALEQLRARVDSLNAEITALPARRTAAVDRIADAQARRSTAVSERNAAVAVAQDETQDRDTRQAARDTRDALIAEIEAIDAALARDRAFRDAVAGLLTALRADRGALVIERDAAVAALAQARTDRDAAIAALEDAP